MIEISETLDALPFCQGMDAVARRMLVGAAEVVEFGYGDVITRQFHPADHLYLLLAGEVEFLIHVDEADGELRVGGTDRLWACLGWSGLRAPYRYATSVRCVHPSTAIRWPHRLLSELCAADPAFGMRLLRFVFESAVDLLGQARALLHYPAPAASPDVLDQQPAHEQGAELGALTSLLRRSPFFETFDDMQLQRLAHFGRELRLRKGNRFLEQGVLAEGLDILCKGRVALDFQRPDMASACSVRYRTLMEPGRVVGYGAMLPDRRSDSSATALEDSVVFRLGRSRLDTLMQDDPAFGVTLYRRLLWLTGNHLRTTRLHLLSQRLHRDVPAIRNLLCQSSPQLPITSALYKIPHLLENRLTQADAFACLELRRACGDPLERQLAGLCLDLLGDLRREMAFYRGLQRVYQSVTGAEPELPPEVMRRQCDQHFGKAFEQVRYAIAGAGHLPSEGGHIFIVNHLMSHPYYALPNGFELSLDTHFVSAMVLYPHYGESAVRVVRLCRGEEHGHHAYYGRLGHIAVRTEQSEPAGPSVDASSAGWEAFVEAAGAHLSAGRN
ncbi:MAG: cyclic nucleotide-binding domain-containing protein, partial [Gammaproteobacteria bacterium]